MLCTLALDPAQVLFQSAGPSDMLEASDADDVEVVHTSGGYLGFQRALGHRDFYPNGGSWPQPGCTLDYAGTPSMLLLITSLVQMIIFYM